MKKSILFLLVCLSIISCKDNTDIKKDDDKVKQVTPIQENLSKYVSVKLTANLNTLSENEKKMLPLLIEAADIMNDLFWYESYGNKEELLAGITDEDTKKFVNINYGPWDRLAGNKSFVEGVGEKPKGANFYPKDMTKEEFEAANLLNKSSLYNIVRRDNSGKLFTVPYHKQFESQVQKVSELLLKASSLAENDGLKSYLELRAQAVLDDQYQKSDLAWMDMKTNTLDIVIGPIESYEDQLFGIKASYEGYVLIKDLEWSK